MTARNIVGGMTVLARDAFGNDLLRVAVTGVMMGHDFPVVWITKPEQYEMARSMVAEGRELLRDFAWPWPAEDVRPA